MKMNPRQQEAVAFRGKHLLVLAGAGSGKTRTIIQRVKALLCDGVPPQKILMLTFTRRASREIEERLLTLSGPQVRKIHSGTFHNFCLREMRSNPSSFNIQNHTIIDRDDQKQLFRLVRAEIIPKDDKNFLSVSKLIDIFSYSRNTNQGLIEYLGRYPEYAEFTPEIVKIIQKYILKKENGHYLDFDDILYLFAKTLKQNKEIQDKIKQKFAHILVDEMQDTNPLQWIILSQLQDPSFLYCVGDDAQSIYAFRGADFKNIHKFSERVVNSTIIKLEENYRSTQEILDLSNFILQQSPIPYEKKLIAVRGSGKKPVLIDFHDKIDEAEWIAQDMLNRHAEGESWKNMMVIMRTSLSARTLEALLIEQNIPYKFIGGPGLANAAHVKDLLSACKAAINPDDEIAWNRYLTLWPKVGVKTAAKHLREIKKLGNPDAIIKYLSDAFHYISEVNEIIETVWQHRNAPTQALSSILILFEDYLQKQYEQWENRKKDIELLIKLAHRHKNISTFIEAYTLEPVSPSTAHRWEQDDTVTLITVHSAKGAEAKICYLLQAQQNMYPHIRSIGDKEQEEEERRILYVAITRAMDELLITRTSDNQFFYSAFPTRPENRYFLANLDDSLVIEKDRRSTSISNYSLTSNETL